MNITYLADTPELIPALAELYYQQWGHYHPEESQEVRIRRLEECCGKRQIPTVFIGRSGTELCGGAMLVAEDMEGRPELTPWLAGVFVKPEFRRQGWASALVGRVVEEARTLKVPKLYLYTEAAERLYAGLGWTTFERGFYKGNNICLMSLNLDPSE